MTLFRNENPILGPLTQITWADGTIHYLVAATDTSYAFSQSSITNERANDAEPTINYAGSVAITGSAAADRGNITVASGTTVASGYVYGTQGKVTVKGTVSSANWLAGLVGQLDLSSATAIAGGERAVIWGDMGASASSGAISGAANCDLLFLTNTAPGFTINSVIKTAALATYFLDVSNASYPSGFSSATSVSTVAGVLAINTPAGIKYIPCYTTKS